MRGAELTDGGSIIKIRFSGSDGGEGTNVPSARRCDLTHVEDALAVPLSISSQSRSLKKYGIWSNPC